MTINSSIKNSSPSYSGATLEYKLKTPKRHLIRAIWSPDGKMLAMATAEKPRNPTGHKKYRSDVLLWRPSTDEYIILERLGGEVSLAFESTSKFLATAGHGEGIRIWDAQTGALLNTLEGSPASISSIAFSPNGKFLAAATFDGKVYVWDEKKPTPRFEVNLRKESPVELAVALSWSADSTEIATAGFAVCVITVNDGRVRFRFDAGGFYDVAYPPKRSAAWIAAAAAGSVIIILDRATGKEIRRLEGHAASIRSLSFSSNAAFLVSADQSGTIILWDCTNWAFVELPITSGDKNATFHPSRPWLLTSAPALDEDAKATYLWELDFPLLFARLANRSVTYTSAKIVLVGESGAGKTGLGWRLAHKKFKEHSSTHGQQFWMLEQLSTTRTDGTQCEAILWDLAGQPDYRLIHALFLDDVDLALILFDPTRGDNPLSGVDFWLNQLRAGGTVDSSTGLRKPAVLLVAARSDRGSARITTEEITRYCEQREIAGFVSTSARNGDGVLALITKMKLAVQWEGKPATVTTTTFQQIKNEVLRLKEPSVKREFIMPIDRLIAHLQKRYKSEFYMENVLTAVGHLAKHGYVTILRTANAEVRVLLAPELLNNLAASFVLEARRNLKGLGALEEGLVLSGGYAFPELETLAPGDQNILRDSAIDIFLKYNICFRETDPLNNRKYLVFPELINLKKPMLDPEPEIEDGVAYTVTGATENAYASLVVLLGYTDTFTRTSQWRDQARYEVGKGFICGFRLEEERGDALHLVLYFGKDVGESVRRLFQGLFESFIARRNLMVQRFEPVHCRNRHLLNRAVVRELRAKEVATAHCPLCGGEIQLPSIADEAQLTQRQQRALQVQSRVASHRSQFEQAVYRLDAYVKERGLRRPKVFFSYAWGTDEHKKWVERLARDLVKGGLDVVLDQWHNVDFGLSVPRFVEQLASCDYVLVVGTNAYKQKYNNYGSGTILAAEGDLICTRLTGNESQKQSVIPLLLEGDPGSSFPVLLGGRTYCDFREKGNYIPRTMELLLSIYKISRQETIASDLLEKVEFRPRSFEQSN